MDWPKITLITPSFNQGAFIEETICSVLEQNYPNLEYIIIDGGSTDQTIEVIKKYGQYLSYWVSEPDRGQSHAINKGLAVATGEIVNWLNSDDLLSDGALFNVADIFLHHTYIHIVSGREIHFNGQQQKEKEGTLIYPSLEETLFHGVIYQPSTFWKLEVLQSLGPVQEGLHYLMDAALWMKYLLQFGQDRIYKTEKVLAHFRLHPSSKTCTSMVLFQQQRWLLRKELLNTFDNTGLYQRACARLCGEQKVDSSNLFDHKCQILNKLSLLCIYRKFLLLEFYSMNEYDWAKRIMKQVICAGEIWSSWNYLKYLIKLFIIPRKVLIYLRTR